MEEPNRNKPFWRQGDIYFVKLDEEIDSEKATAVKNGIIAKGETTGTRAPRVPIIHGSRSSTQSRWPLDVPSFARSGYHDRAR